MRQLNFSLSLLPVVVLAEKVELDIDVEGKVVDGPLPEAAADDGNSDDPEEVNEELMCVK
jgi:hypothetical protein